MLDDKDREDITQIVKDVIESDVTPKFEELSNKIHAVDEKLSNEIHASEERSRKYAAHILDVHFDAKVMPMFDLLFDKINAMDEKLIPASRVEDIEHKVNVHEMAIRKLSEDVKELKEA